CYAVKTITACQSRYLLAAFAVGGTLQLKIYNSGRPGSVDAGSRPPDNFRAADITDIHRLNPGRAVGFGYGSIVDIHFQSPDTPGSAHAVTAYSNAGVRQVALVHPHAGHHIECC